MLVPFSSPGSPGGCTINVGVDDGFRLPHGQTFYSAKQWRIDSYGTFIDRWICP